MQVLAPRAACNYNTFCIRLATETLGRTRITHFTREKNMQMRILFRRCSKSSPQIWWLPARSCTPRCSHPSSNKVSPLIALLKNGRNQATPWAGITNSSSYRRHVASREMRITVYDLHQRIVQCLRGHRKLDWVARSEAGDFGMSSSSDRLPSVPHAHAKSRFSAILFTARLVVLQALYILLFKQECLLNHLLLEWALHCWC